VRFGREFEYCAEVDPPPRISVGGPRVNLSVVALKCVDALDHLLLEEVDQPALVVWPRVVVWQSVAHATARGVLQVATPEAA
jgi:hypothetical protein